MSVNYSIPTENARLQAVINQIDAGAGPGVLKVGTAGMAVILVTIPLNKPSGTAAGGVLSFVVPDSATVAVDGTMVLARIEDSNGNTIISGLTVGTGAGVDITAINTTISVGQTVSLALASITGG